MDNINNHNENKVTSPDQLLEDINSDKSLRPTSFNDFIGQEKIIDNLKVYIKAAKNPLRFIGINKIGLERNGFKKSQIENVSSMCRILFQEGNNNSKAIQILEKNIKNCIEKEEMIKFIKNSRIGILKGFY